MATARQASLPSMSSNGDLPLSPGVEPATVEESIGDIELITLLREAAVTGSRPLESIVDALADGARVLSGAEGTALGLETRGIIVCRARSGSIAPPIGAPISAESGLSGACLRTGTILVCQDAMTDSRVDAEVCRTLGIRSVAAVPVRGSKRVAGILEAFSSRPNAFDSDALRVLRDLAEVAELGYRHEMSSYVLAVKPQTPAAKPGPEVPSAVTHPSARPAQQQNLQGVWQPGKNQVIWVVGVALALLVIVGVARWAWRTSADETASGTTQNVRAASPDPTPSMPALTLVPKPAPGVATGHSDHSRPGIVQNAADVKPIDLRSGPTASETIEVPIPKVAAEGATPVPEPPAVSFSPSGNSEALTQLSSVPEQMPVAGPRISQFAEATLIHRAEPTYSMDARAKHLEGKVTLLATIATDGTVQQVTVQAGPPILAQAAKAAIQQWRYRPATLNGTPVEVKREITVFFKEP